jgi:hypothetical protein
MTVAVTTLRSTIATALSNPTVWQVFSFPPASPLANSVVVEPDDPYLIPTNNSKNLVSPMANFRIKLYLPLLDNQGALMDIEEFIVGVFNKLSESTLNYNIGSVSGVSVDSTAGDLLTCEMRVSILTSWS